MDHRTRQLHAWQEGVVISCLLLAGALAWLVFGLVSGDQIPIVSGAFLTIGQGLLLSAKLRQRP